MKYYLLLCSFLIIGYACQPPTSSTEESPVQESAVTDSQSKKTGVQLAAESTPTHIKAMRVMEYPKLDGYPYEAHWKNSPWLPIDQLWLGDEYSKEDFSGNYKVAWSEDYVYLLVQIVDDVFQDKNPDGLNRYWDDDSMEVFIDEDQSGGEHQYNHNAFAYHVAKDSRVVDIGTNREAQYYNDHFLVDRKQAGSVYTWEMAMLVYKDSYQDDSDRNIPVRLSAGKKMGFALAYCDNDFSKEREHFIGSVPIEGEDKNIGWINADVFGTLELVE